MHGVSYSFGAHFLAQKAKWKIHISRDFCWDERRWRTKTASQGVWSRTLGDMSCLSFLWTKSPVQETCFVSHNALHSAQHRVETSQNYGISAFHTCIVIDILYLESLQVCMYVYVLKYLFSPTPIFKKKCWTWPNKLILWPIMWHDLRLENSYVCPRSTTHETYIPSQHHPLSGNYPAFIHSDK